MPKDQTDRANSGQRSGGKGGSNGTATPPVKDSPQGGSPNGHVADQNGDQPKNKPVHEIRMGRICGAIWPQQGTEGQTWFNVTLSRIYRDNGGAWQRSDSFGRTDLPLVAKVADQCHTWIYQQGQAQEDQG